MASGPVASYRTSSITETYALPFSNTGTQDIVFVTHEMFSYQDMPSCFEEHLT